MTTKKPTKSKVPRGIQVVQWTNADGSTTTKYRVRISRKDYVGKRNNYFDDVKEAISFLTLSKTEKGKELIYSISEEERQRARREAIQEKEGKDFTFEYVAKRWLLDQVFTDPELRGIDIEDEKSLKTLPELKRRNIAMKKAVIKKICSISIPDRYITNEEKLAMGIDHESVTYRHFGKFDVRTEMSKIDLNNYIKARLQGDKKNKPIKPISVVREITYISNVYNNLENIDEAYEDIFNVTRLYNKNLLKNTINYRKRILTEEEEARFLEAINNYSNKELADICKLSLLTSMRRSEIIYLKKSNISKDFRIIHLKQTKSGRPRDVYLDETAREFLMNLEPSKGAKGDRFFTYTIMGFGRVFAELMSRTEGLDNVHFHDLRRTKVSRMLSTGGEENTMLVAKLLGFSSVRKFEAIHTKGNSNLSTQRGITNSNGHSLEVAFKHYLNPVMSDVEKLQKIKELKAKKQEGKITEEETQELLNLVLSMME